MCQKLSDDQVNNMHTYVFGACEPNQYVKNNELQ